MAKWGEGRSKEWGEKGGKRGEEERGERDTNKSFVKISGKGYIQILSLSQPAACLIAVTTSPCKPSYLGTSVT